MDCRVDAAELVSRVRSVANEALVLGDKMAIFGLFLVLPFGVYCAVQTFRDFRRKSYVMAVWGSAMTLFATWCILGVMRAMPGSY